MKENLPGQIDMFGYPRRPGFVADSDTSERAAESLPDGYLNKLRRAIYEFICAAHDGATCDEVEVALGLRHQTASARIRELAMAKRIVDSGRRRLTRTRRNARIYRSHD